MEIRHVVALYHQFTCIDISYVPLHYMYYWDLCPVTCITGIYVPLHVILGVMSLYMYNWELRPFTLYVLI